MIVKKFVFEPRRPMLGICYTRGVADYVNVRCEVHRYMALDLHSTTIPQQPLAITLLTVPQ